MRKEMFINSVSQKMKNMKCELFVGSGISSGSGVPSWVELLKEPAREIGIDIGEEDDLPLIAQYIVNENSGNNNILRTLFAKVFKGKEYQTCDYHHSIRLMKLKTIWTTNYDDLIEKTFIDKRNHVISTDKDMGEPIEFDELEIIKIHGSISQVDNCILTQQDYDEFAMNRPAISQRLRDALLKDSILFIGYGYRDPDIRNIMIESMKLIGNHTLEHYIILKNIERHTTESDEVYSQRRRRFTLWIKELNRIGIRELLIDTFEELSEVLNSIAIASRGKTIYVTGSHTNDELEYFSSIGTLLASIDELVLINGQSEGVGISILNSYMEKCIKDKKDLNRKIKISPNPYSANSDSANDIALIPLLKTARKQMLQDTKIFLFYQGGIGTKAELETARECKCIAIPGISKQEDYDNQILIDYFNDRDYIEYVKSLHHECAQYMMILENKKIPTNDDLEKMLKELMNI